MFNDREFYRQIARTVIDLHKSRGECEFAPNAVDDVAAEVLTKVVDRSDEAAVIDAMEEAIKRTEIYCPHEGIDRRAEFGVAA